MASDKIYVVCPRCESPDVVCDASATWDYDSQEWVIAGTYDDRTCNTCGYDSSSFDEATRDELTKAQLAHIENGDDFDRVAHQRQVSA